MKKVGRTIGKIVQWFWGISFLICILAYGFHISSLFMLFAGVLMLPLKSLEEIYEKFKIKKWIVICVSIFLVFVGTSIAPVSTVPDSNNSGIEQDAERDDKKDDKDQEDAEQLENDNKEDSKEENKESDDSKEESEGQKVQNVGAGTAVAVDPAKIPAYSGKAYITINNNEPSFLASELKTKGYETYSSLDSLGRCRTALASVGKDTMPKEGEERGSISSIKPTGWKQATYDNISGKYLYNRCHLIGWQLSAENANRANLITGTKYLNIEGMLPFENMVADYIKETGNHVAYRITPIYVGNNLLASGVQMEAYSVEDKGEGICFNVYCYNVQPGITIDYATGSSTGPSTSVSNGTTGGNNTTSSTGTTNGTTSTPESNATQKPTVQEPENTAQVWIPATGDKYHSKNNCGRMNPDKARQMSKSEAEANGYTACSKCY